MDKIGYGGAIFGASRRVWGEAVLEIAVVAGVSLIPLLGASLREVLPPDSTVYLSDAFERSFLSGQLLFYALGLIATVVWQANRDYKSFFPLRTIFNLYCMTCVVICSIIIGFDPELHAINKGFVGPTSVLIFSISLFAYLLMAVISQVHVNVGKSLAKEDADLSNAVKNSRGLQ